MTAAVRPAVLVVDDEQAHCELLFYVLRKDYEVHTATSVEAALAIASRAKLDIALVDYRMPGVPGIRLLEELRRSQPQCMRFLVTAYGDSAVLTEAINQGSVYRFIAKPIDPEQLRLDILRGLEFRDTEEKLHRAENLAVLGQLAGSVVHDLRNYLVVLRVAPDLLEEGDSAQVRDIAGRLRSVERAMFDLVEELLSLARGQVPRYELRQASLGEIAASTLKISQLSKVLTDRELDVQIEPDLPPLPLSPSRCARMIDNLVKNAAEATEPGGHIAVRIRRETPDSVVLEVEDDGCGIPADMVDRVFDPLVSTKGPNGVGFGLSVCKTVMEGHGGTLTCQSAPSRGTKFVARFPVAGNAM
jgi:signal transduction histidine kinase